MEAIFRQLKLLLWLLGLVTGLVVVIFVVNQTYQVVALATALSPLLGTVVLYALLAIYLAVILCPLVMLIIMSPPLTPPTSQLNPEYPRFLRQLCQRLCANPHTKNMPVNPTDMRSIEAALLVLDQLATKRIKGTAAQVFVATSVSQYGGLDGLLVLMAQVRLIWQLANIYNTRPHWRDILKLYLNVGATVVVASEIENIDLIEHQLEPLLTSVLGSGVAVVASGAGALVFNSLLQGAANAFLTLRVGVITKGYLAALQKPSSHELRKTALVQSTALLSAVLTESLGTAIRSIIRVAKRSTAKVAKANYHKVVQKSKQTATSGRKVGEQIARGVSDAVKMMRNRLGGGIFWPKG